MSRAVGCQKSTCFIMFFDFSKGGLTELDYSKLYLSGVQLRRVKPCQASTGKVKKHYKTYVILRIWLTEIDPIAPAHDTYVYKTNVKSII